MGGGRCPLVLAWTAGQRPALPRVGCTKMEHLPRTSDAADSILEAHRLVCGKHPIFPHLAENRNKAAGFIVLKTHQPCGTGWGMSPHEGPDASSSRGRSATKPAGQWQAATEGDTTGSCRRNHGGALLGKIDLRGAIGGVTANRKLFENRTILLRRLNLRYDVVSDASCSKRPTA